MAEAADPILLYHPDAYRIDRKDIKGRRSAGDSFLGAFLAQASGPDVYALCESRLHSLAFSETVALRAGNSLPSRSFAGTLRRCVRDRSCTCLIQPSHAKLGSAAFSETMRMPCQE